MKPGPKSPDAEQTEPAERVIVVRVTARQRAELDQVAAELGLDLSDVIRDSVDGFVGDYRERVIFDRRDRITN